MTIRLTNRAYAEFRRLRRRHAPGRTLGPHWTVLGSDVLFAALDLAGIPPASLLVAMSRNGQHPSLGRRSPLFSRILPQLPTLTTLDVRLGIVEVRCTSGVSYLEERHRPTVVAYGVRLPEQVLISAPGMRLSQLCDVAAMPALLRADPVIRRAKNVIHVHSGGNDRLELELEVAWRTFAPVP